MSEALTVACAASGFALVVAEWRALPVLRGAAKLAASAAFVGIGIEALRVGHDPHRVAFAQWILLGLVLGAVGDAALLGRSKRWFLGGLVAFLLGHLAYVMAASRAAPAAAWLHPLAAIPVIAGGLALLWLWPRLGSLRVPVIIYVAAIVTMVIAAIAVARSTAVPDPQRTRFLVGASLFFASDLAVARDRFVARELANKLWGLPAYYAGQLLIAWSVIGL